MNVEINGVWYTQQDAISKGLLPNQKKKPEKVVKKKPEEVKKSDDKKSDD